MFMIPSFTRQSLDCRSEVIYIINHLYNKHTVVSFNKKKTLLYKVQTSKQYLKSTFNTFLLFSERYLPNHGGNLDQ